MDWVLGLCGSDCREGFESKADYGQI